MSNIYTFFRFWEYGIYYGYYLSLILECGKSEL